MGLIDFLLRLFCPARPSGREWTRRRRRRIRRRARLSRLNYHSRPSAVRSEPLETADSPYLYATRGIRRGHYFDLSRDGDTARLNRYGLPVFHTPEELAAWLGLRPGRAAWLTHRFDNGLRPENQQRSHYHYRWIVKRGGGHRLLEAPKPLLKRVQRRIADELLSRIPPHETAHGFVRRRSIVTNAKPHVGNRVVVKLDLENFYATVTYSRVVAIFRRLGYSREAALWLARLTTSRLPPNLSAPGSDPLLLKPYLRRHLPQGAPTSPALANLSAFSLDVRLSGLARSFGAAYTRYADDLTFSGPRRFLRSLPVFIPLCTQLIRQERFRVNRRKRKIVRDNQRQTVTGVVVNAKPNVSRRDFDRLKATLTNCARHGPSGQNRDGHRDLKAHLRGRVAHVLQLNPQKGRKLLRLFAQIDWSR